MAQGRGILIFLLFFFIDVVSLNATSNQFYRDSKGAIDYNANSNPIQEIRVIPVTSSIESNTVITQIIFPRPYENKRKNPVNVQLRIEGFPLGINTQNDRAEEIYNGAEGQTIHVIIDNDPYLVYNQSFEDSFDENREYYDKILSFYIPFNLTPGQHTIRAFPALSYGESFKDRHSFAAGIFYFQDGKKSDIFNINLNAPYLTYNEPQGFYPADKAEPILLDFLLANCELSPEGYKVRLTVDGKVVKFLTQWVPYYIYGLSAGKHSLKLELLDHNNKVVPGFFNVIEREIQIDRK